jgi:hypothetical protein
LHWNKPDTILNIVWNLCVLNVAWIVIDGYCQANHKGLKYKYMDPNNMKNNAIDNKSICVVILCILLLVCYGCQN